VRAARATSEQLRTAVTTAAARGRAVSSTQAQSAQRPAASTGGEPQGELAAELDQAQTIGAQTDALALGEVPASGTIDETAANGAVISSSGVAMQDMIESIGATIELAAREGISRARIELQPADLGHISIRLTQTSEGLRARVSADTPAGAQALAQGRSELRQSLSSLGVSLLRLDIGSFAQSQTRGGEQGFAGPSKRVAVPGAHVVAEEGEPSGESAEPGRPNGPAMGEIVDVLA
jgi:flagellar hook-length control protein FliK